MHVIDIKCVCDRWDRWVLVRGVDSPSRRYWTGRTWVQGLRNARLYADLRFVLTDLVRACVKR